MTVKLVPKEFFFDLMEIYRVLSLIIGPKYCRFFIYSGYTLTYQIVVAHQISVALGTFSEINNSSPSNNHSLGKNF